VAALAEAIARALVELALSAPTAGKALTFSPGDYQSVVVTS